MFVRAGIKKFLKAQQDNNKEEMKTTATATVAGAGAQQATAAVDAEESKKSINSELWQACAGPLVNLPAAGSHVVYFPQGHSEQVAASMKKDVDAQIPNHPNLPSKLLCLLHSVTLQADPETDEVYAQMTLQPVPSFDKEALLRSDLSMKANKPQTDFFCKTLTASDTSTHGGFSVPRRAAEKIFPSLDFTMQPPAQELVAHDLHDNVWTFRHIYRGQPKRHLLTTGWSLFVSGKRLFAGDSVLFIRDEKQQLLLGIRRAHRQPTNLSSSVLSSDSMHIGILAAAAHAAANNSPFTVFFNPRASPSEFVIPLAKYYKAVCSNQMSLGMRFRMMFETEESGTRRYMGTITGISDLDPVRWKNSQWRNLQVGWDESTAGERRNRVSIWEIEPITAPFFICPTLPFFRSKRPRQPGMPEDDSCDLDNLFRRSMPWLGDEFGLKEAQQPLPGLSLVQWMNMQHNTSMQPSNYMNSLSTSVLQTLTGTQFGLPTTQIPQQNNLQQQLDQPQKLPSFALSPLASIIQPQQLTGQNVMGQSPTLPTNQVQSQNPIQNQNLLNQQLKINLSQNLPQEQNLMWSYSQSSDHVNQHQLHVPENQIQLQLLEKLHQQQQALLAQHTSRDHHKLLDIPTNFSKPISAANQILETSQSHVITAQQQMMRNKLEARSTQGPTFNPINSQISAGGGQSAVTDDVPSCSTSPSTNNCQNSVINSRNLNPSGLETLNTNNIIKDFQQKPEVKLSLNISKSHNHRFFASQTYLNDTGTHIDYLDSSSSATSVLSQNDVQIAAPGSSNNSMSFNSLSMPFMENQLGMMPMMPDSLITKDMVGPISNDDMHSGFVENSNPKEGQPELSSSMVEQSFGVPEMGFNSVASTINDGSFMNGGAWAPPQIPRMRTYTKVYKRGAVGRSIDIGRYAGYDELKQDLARRFGIEGQLEDQQRIGWKLVYVDHENDVLLVGDDPWDEFVNCVRCIKILSPQEVQQMSLDGDVGNNVHLPNQACSSSDNGFN